MSSEFPSTIEAQKIKYLKSKSSRNGWHLATKQKEINLHDKVKGHVKIIKLVGSMTRQHIYKLIGTFTEGLLS